MAQMTLTMAGQQAVAGVARPAGSRLRPVSPLAGSLALATSGYGHPAVHAWNVEIAKPATATFTVFDGKDRPTRQPSELSP